MEHDEIVKALAEKYRNKGYSVETNFAYRIGGNQYEADIVAKRGDKLTIVEVKSRATCRTLEHAKNQLLRALSYFTGDSFFDGEKPKHVKLVRAYPKEGGIVEETIS